MGIEMRIYSVVRAAVESGVANGWAMNTPLEVKERPPAWLDEVLAGITSEVMEKLEEIMTLTSDDEVP